MRKRKSQDAQRNTPSWTIPFQDNRFGSNQTHSILNIKEIKMNTDSMSREKETVNINHADLKNRMFTNEE